MKRVAGWGLGILLVIIGSLSLAGWTRATDEVASLERLADGILHEQGRLWVVSARTSEGLLRWSGEKPEDALQWIEQTKASLRGEEPVFYVNVQGALDSGQTLQTVWHTIESEAGTSLIEGYEDDNTFSYSYLSSRFGGGISSGSTEINLQAAAHWDTETQRWRITIGTPVILIEY